MTSELPPGLSLDPLTGTINGTPTGTGIYQARVIYRAGQWSALPANADALKEYDILGHATIRFAKPSEGTLTIAVAHELGVMCLVVSELYLDEPEELGRRLIRELKQSASGY